MKNKPPRTALITGASSGIGWELAQLLAADGYNLVLVARTEEKLLELSDIVKEKHAIETWVVTADLADPQVPESIHEILDSEGITVDVLVNNAGFGIFGKFHQKGLDEQLELMQVNMTSLVELTHRFLPGMIERGQGKIMNLASTAGFQPGPGMNLYYASKAFIISFSEALSHELRGTGVTVTCFCPGITITNFHLRAGMTKTGLSSLPTMSAPKAAAIGYRGLQAGKRLVISGLFNRLGAFNTRFIPRSWMLNFVARLQQDRGVAFSE